MKLHIRTAAVFLAAAMLTLCSCGASGRSRTTDSTSEESAVKADIPTFQGDSAFAYVKHQVEMGPRVPNSAAHAKAVEWMSSELRKRGADVTLQPMKLTAFDGTVLNATNILGRFNPAAEERILLLAHFDCRPWADEDKDAAKRRQPVDGANDGASGVGVLLEMARLLQSNPVRKELGVDILFLDAEDWGTEGDDESWALGAKYFAQNPPVEGYFPSQAILLDMVGSKDATFYVEYFSREAAPELTAAVWQAAQDAGYGSLFPTQTGSAVTDDHRPLIEVGIPAIDIIDYRPGVGFDPVWHTSADGLDNISKDTLKGVGQTLAQYIWSL